MSQGTDIPITCKVRLLDNIDDTIEMCRLLVGAGCSILTVHGRTKKQIGHSAGECNWDAIARYATINTMLLFVFSMLAATFDQCITGYA
jgi:tRNA-dihydrouridine synthase